MTLGVEDEEMGVREQTNTTLNSLLGEHWGYGPLYVDDVNGLLREHWSHCLGLLEALLQGERVTGCRPCSLLGGALEPLFRAP